jgi:hypothetical protein
MPRGCAPMRCSLGRAWHGELIHSALADVTPFQEWTCPNDQPEALRLERVCMARLESARGLGRNGGQDAVRDQHLPLTPGSCCHRAPGLAGRLSIEVHRCVGAAPSTAVPHRGTAPAPPACPPSMAARRGSWPGMTSVPGDSKDATGGGAPGAAPGTTSSIPGVVAETQRFPMAASALGVEIA